MLPCHRPPLKTVRNLEIFGRYSLAEVCQPSAGSQSTQRTDGFRANEPGKLRPVGVEPFRDSVRRRTHDIHDFAIETVEHGVLLVGMKQFGIPSQCINPINDTTEGPERFHPLLKRPRPAHLKLENQEALGEIVGSNL